MQIVVVHPRAAAAPAVVKPAPVAPLVGVDRTLAPDGIAMPKVSGLPDWSTPGQGPSKLLAPPKPDSPAGKAELDVVHAIQKLRTPEGDAWAVKLAREGAVQMWFDFAKQHRGNAGKVSGWLGTALLAGTIAANSAVTTLAKQRFDRLRPFEVDPSIKPPVRLPHDSSFPSGHASSAFAAARVIAVLDPKLAKDAYKLASQVAVSRVYAGVHFPSDVVAGALLGTAVAEVALRTAGKAPSLAEAP